MLKKDVVEFKEVLADMVSWGSEYLLSLSQTVVEDKWVWHLLIAYDKVGIKLEECEEVVGGTLEELRLNFLIKLAEMRKERLDKLEKRV